jgi:hypothetical protein
MFAKADAGGSGAAPAAAAASVGEQVAEKQAAASGALVVHTAPVIAQGGVVLNGRAFKVKQVTRNVFPQRDGQTLFVKITGAVYQGKALENGKSEMAPAELAEVINLESGILGLIIVNKVLHGQLDDLYPDAAYVGKSFAVTMSPVEGKRYKAFTLYELDDSPAAAE